MNNFLYTFVTDLGVKKLTHRDFLKDEELVERVLNPDNTRLFLGFTIFAVPPKFLKGQLLQQLKDLAADQKENPLAYYAPNSQEQMDFINDDEATISSMVDSNRSGKTTAAWVKVCVSDPPLFPCDPEWPIFKNHGIRYRPYRGPISVGAASYNTAKLEDPMWKEMVHKWTPNWELGQYARGGGKASPSFGHDRLTRLECGSTIGWYTYEMDQGNYEGGALHKWLWDEQGREAMFDGADRGTRTTSGKHLFSLTPHTVDGRPDSGGAGWLCKFLDGKRTKGHKVIKTYTSGDIRDIPCWIYAEASKEIEFEKWEYEPSRPETFDAKVLAEGRARLYGEWHRIGGMVLDEWDPQIHWIEPPWDYPPNDVTLYRAIDHGLRQPTVCLGIAVDSRMNIFLYREYYSTGKQISEVVSKIIEAWGNHRKPLDKWSDPASGIVMPRYEEVYDREWVSATAMDSRSMKIPEKLTMKEEGWLYRAAGLSQIRPASGKSHEHWVPMVNQLLLNSKLIAQGELDPAKPSLYVFNRCLNFKREIEGWTYEAPKRATDKISTKPSDKDDHGPQALGYACQIPLRYLGGHHPSHGKKFDRKPGPGYWDDPNEPGRSVPKLARRRKYRRMS